jgi:Fe-S cluster assembly iron-binding protein IscA
MFVRCPFCHRRVLRWFYPSHERKHTQRRSDGQMTEHVTAPPEDRYSGSLDGVPQGYRHAACGVVTRMPEEIIRTYLVNPLTYNDGSFCCGCGTYVDSSQLVWQETGEKVMDYMGRLRLEYLRKKLGMQLSDRPTGVVLTPRAARKLKEVMRESGFRSPCVAVTLADEKSTSVSMEVAERATLRKETVLTVAGIYIAVPKKQADRIAGTVIDYLEAPQPGFSVARLYAPSEKG